MVLWKFIGNIIEILLLHTLDEDKLQMSKLNNIKSYKILNCMYFISNIIKACHIFNKVFRLTASLNYVFK